MLLRNDLLHYQQPSPRTIRILWIDPGQNHAYVYDVAARSAEVEPVQVAALHADLQAGHAIVLENDPYLMLVCQELLPPKYLQLRARAWQIIAPLVAQEPDIYDARRRGQMIARASSSNQVSHPTIYRYLRRYWQRGQTPNALLPDYSNSGGKGKVRQSSAGVKRGRPRKNGGGDGPGVNADEEIRRIFRVAIGRYDAAHQRFSRLGAYQQMLKEFFVERRIDPYSGRVQAVPVRHSPMLPTFGQFNYWLDHDDDRPPEAARRQAGAVLQGARPAQPVAMPLPAALMITATSAPAGRPGASYYLEAVCAEVQLVSRADREQAIGRPRIYVVTDSFSGMVTGIHIGFGPPTWQQAMLALAHCSADKQRYSQQYGRLTDSAQWPCRHLPELLHVHGALAAGWNGDTLLNNFNLRCTVADSGPAHWKTVLERRFRLLAAEQEGAASRLDGVLDVAQFTRIVIDCIVYYNNRHPQHLGATGANVVTPSAVQLWDWGVQHRSGALKTYPEHLVRCSLMPVAPAIADGAGIHFAGSVYTCLRAEQEGWSERARQRGAWQVKLAYDPSSLDTVYLLDATTPMLFQACQLADSDNARRGLCSAELAHLPSSNPLVWAAATSSSIHHGAPVVA